jgi:hypothetical protein
MATKPYSIPNSTVFWPEKSVLSTNSTHSTM